MAKATWDISMVNKGDVTKLGAKEVAEYFGISPNTLRFYEHKGVIPPVQRDKNGYRVYTDTEMNWIYLALSLKRIGLSLEKITEFTHLVLQKTGNTQLAQKEILYEQLNEIDQKLRNLSKTRARLRWEIDHFDEYLGQLNIGSLTAGRGQDEWKQFKK